MKAIIRKLENLTHEPGFIYTLALILLRDLFFAPQDAAEINWHEHLNFQEITFLVGLFIKREPSLELPTEEEATFRFKETYRLLDDLHKEHHRDFMERLEAVVKTGLPLEDPEGSYRRTLGAGSMMTEPIFYGGSGAYDFQYLTFAAEKYASDKEWILNRVGIEISEMANISRALKTLHERTYHARSPSQFQDFSNFCREALSVFCFCEEDLPQFDAFAVRSFIDTFALTPGNVNPNLCLPGQYNELQSKPIVRLPDGRHFLPVGFNLCEAIYEGPFCWMNKDCIYSAEALLHRGRFAEEATAKLLRRVFGAENVYTNVEVKASKSHTLTEIDVLAIVGNKAVICQVKSKRLTELAKLGDDGRLASDFKLAIQEAYDQGLLCREAIVNKGNRLFADGKEIVLSDQIDDAYILCVTIDHYPAVMHQVDMYLDKQDTDPFPVALSIFDLDMIAFYLPDPFEFAYYLRQRTSLSDYYKADTEMSLLGFHLTHKLFKKDGTSLEVVGPSFAQLIDANFPVLRGSVPHTTAADKLRAQWKNDEFQTIVNQAKTSRQPMFTDAVFLLFDLAGEAGDELIDVLKLVKRRTMADNRSHDARLPISSERSGITILSHPNSLHELEKKLLTLARMAKYKSKADVWLALGCLASSDRLVDTMLFTKSPWKEDPASEKLAEQLRGRIVNSSGRKIGRNEPCPCKSGKKFKRCHGA